MGRKRNNEAQRLLSTIRSGSRRLLKTLLPSAERHGLLSLQSSSVLHEAASKGRATVCRDLISLAPSLINAKDSEGRTPLMLACDGNHVATVKLLLSEGASPGAEDWCGKNAIRHAVDAGAKASLTALLVGADGTGDLHSPDVYGVTPIVASASLEDASLSLAITLRLLRHHARPWDSAPDGRSPISSPHPAVKRAALFFMDSALSGRALSYH